MIGWLDAGSGASGDMLLGALIGAGVPLEVIAASVRAVAPEAVSLAVEQVTRSGFAATRCHVEVAESRTHRTWHDIAVLLAQADLDEGVRRRASATFERLATAEAKVHGTSMDKVTFHEVGALDSIADVVGACAGLQHLALDELVVSAVAVGSGTITGAHGTMAVPPPAVAELLREVPSYAGPVPREMCTPTGAALVATNATSFGAQPAMTVRQIGVGAGGRDPEGHPNVLRLFVGKPMGSTSRTAPTRSGASPLLIETNIDDLDPRLWPNVIAALILAGAADAWLTPILMKKGRPAHTLSVLVSAEQAAQVRTEIFRQTSTIGVRELTIGKHALDREMSAVTVSGHTVRVKLALQQGEIVNIQPEYDDVAAVADATNRPIKDVLDEASAASRTIER